MNSIRSYVVAASFAFIGAMSTVPAQAAVQAGVLSCRSGPSVGLILGSVRGFTCVYRPSDPRQPRQFYNATVGLIGVDIGVSAGSQLVWAVFAPTAVIRPGDLSGTYVGGRRRRCGRPRRGRQRAGRRLGQLDRVAAAECGRQRGSRRCGRRRSPDAPLRALEKSHRLQPTPAWKLFLCFRAGMSMTCTEPSPWQATNKFVAVERHVHRLAADLDRGLLAE